jgi:O-antigen/teichoic acid export membrane protein
MRFKKNIFWSLAGNSVPLMAGVVVIPYLLKMLGNEAFGVLSIVWAVIGYFSFFDFGVGRALTVEISKHQSAGNTNRGASVLRAGLLLTLVSGTIGALILLACSSMLAHALVANDEMLRNEAKDALQVTAYGVVLSTLTSGIRGALEGYNRFAESNISRMTLGLLMFIVPAIAVYLLGPNIFEITLYLVYSRLLVAVIGLLQLKDRLIYNSYSFSYDDIRALLGFGLWMTVTGIVSPLMVYGDRIFVGWFLGVSEIPYYAIPQEGLLRLLIIPVAIGSALLPMMAVAPFHQQKIIYRKSLYRMSFIMLLTCLSAGILSSHVLSWWLGDDFADKSAPIVYILLIGIFFNSIANIPYTLLHSKGDARTTAIFHCGELLLYIIALWLLSAKFGLVGAATAWMSRTLIDLVLLHLAANRLTNGKDV